MGCCAAKAEDPARADATVDLEAVDLESAHDTEKQAKELVEGTSDEVSAAAEAEAKRQGERWRQLSWQRRQELCSSAAATVLEKRTAAQPPAVQTLVKELRALDPPAATASASTIPPFPRLGVSLALLHLLAPLVPDGATTAEACFNTFKPLAARALSSVADCLVRLGSADPATGLPYAATATVFASHAWKYPFKLVLAALDAFAAAQPDPKRVYVWFDCLVVNQHASAALPQEWWSTAFAAGIEAIGHTCLVLWPWSDPMPLKRCWCLWEILKTVACGARLTVQLPPSEAAAFERALLTNFDSIQRLLAEIDARRAEAFKEEDQRMILAAVAQDVGFTKLNQVVGERLRAWLVEASFAALDRLPRAERGTSVLINNLAQMLKDQGDLAGAEPLMREYLEASREVKGDRHQGTLIAINNLGSLLKAKGDMAGAEPLFREALEAKREVLGDRHPDTLTMINNLGSLLEAKGDMAGAEPLYREALEARREVLGDRHPDTLGSINNLGLLLQAKRDVAGAEPLLRSALEAWREVEGDRHPNTLVLIGNHVDLLRTMGRLAEAEAALGDAVAMAQEVLGDGHLSTLVITAKAARLQHAQPGGGTAGKELLAATVARMAAVLGESHQQTTKYREALEGMEDGA